MEAGDRLGIDDRPGTDAVQRLGQRYTHDLRDHLVLLVLMSLVPQSLGEEQMDALVAEAGGGENGPERAHPLGDQADLLAQLADRARLRRLVGPREYTGGQLPDVAADRVAVLADHDHPPLP